MDILQKQIAHIPTSALEEFVTAVKTELALRKKETGLNAERARHASAPVYFSSRDEVDDFNCSKPLQLPNTSLAGRIVYLDALMRQPWVLTDTAMDSDGRNCYVYAHVDPSSRNFSCQPEYGGNFGGTPFYIGKGSGDRYKNLKRNQAHGENIRRVLSMGYKTEDIAKILISGLTSQEALVVEAKFIYFFGSIFDRKDGVLVNHDRKTPEFVGRMEKRSSKAHWAKAWNKEHPAISKKAGV